MRNANNQFKQLNKALIPLLLFIFSFSLRLAFMSKGPYNGDCLTLVMRALESIETRQLQYHIGFGSPVEMILAVAFILLGRVLSIFDPVVAVNLMSVVTSSFCVVVLYKSAKILFDEKTAFISASILSLTPIFLGISIYGKSHALALLFLLTGLYCFWLYEKTQNKMLFATSAIHIGLLGGTRLQDLFVMALPICLLFFGKNILSPKIENNKNKTMKTLISYWCIVFLTLFLCYAPIIFGANQPDFIKSVTKFYQYSLEGYKGFFPLYMLSYEIKCLIKALTGMGMIVAVGGLILINRKTPRMAIFFLLWIILPLLIFARIPTFVPRYLTIVMPPLIMSLAYAISRALSLHSRIKFLASLMLIWILVAPAWLVYPYFIYRHNYAHLPDFCHWLAQKTEPNACIITHDENIFVRYYAKRETLKKPTGAIQTQPEKLMHFKNQLDAMLKRDIPVYITGTGLFSDNQSDQFIHLIKGNYRLHYIGNHLYEDWHRGELTQLIFFCELFQITKK